MGRLVTQLSPLIFQRSIFGDSPSEILLISFRISCQRETGGDSWGSFTVLCAHHTKWERRFQPILTHMESFRFFRVINKLSKNTPYRWIKRWKAKIMYETENKKKPRKVLVLGGRRICARTCAFKSRPSGKGGRSDPVRQRFPLAPSTSVR